MTAPATTQTKTQLVATLTTNEWGQLTNLEPNTAYYVIRRPTSQMTKERSQQFVTEVRAFLHEQRLVTEKQMQELNEKYGQPAKLKAKELRETLEKRFDEIAKDVEMRVGELETKVNEKAPAFIKTYMGKETPAPTGDRRDTPGNNPGEMPLGDHPAPATESPAGSPTATQKKNKKHNANN